MTNILTAVEAATILRCENNDPNMLQLLPLIDAYIQRATGRDWTVDAPISGRAKAAAMMLLVMWHENPGQMGDETPLHFGLSAVLTQLEADALAYKTYSFAGLCTSGLIYLGDSARNGDQVISLVGIVGVSGDQSSGFESVLGQDYCIAQTTASDLSAYQYYVTLISAVDALK